MINKHKYLEAVVLLVLFCKISCFPAIQESSDNNLQSIDVSSTKKMAAPDITTTIDQVHKMLEEDPTLPRLTKGEIEELFEQVTKEEYEKSLQFGDLKRANNMRALMLVLPYNTNNSTEENLQELYTRPPITKVIESYSVPVPKKFSTASPANGKVEIVEIGNVAATTYKPSIRFKEKIMLNPTTYHPDKPLLRIPNQTTTQVPVTALPLLPDIEEEERKATRYSSSYNAKDADWSLLEGESNNKINMNTQFAPMPDLAGLFKTMGMGTDAGSSKRFKLDEYRQAVKPPMSSSIRQASYYPVTLDVADFTRTLPPRPNLEAYSEFKPLNIGEEIRVKPDVEDYLSRFGLVSRKRKQIKPEDSGQVSIETTIHTKEQPIKRMDTDVSEADLNDLRNQHDLDQLNKLLKNLKELESLNVSLSSDMLSSVDLKRYNFSDNIQSKGPDPVTNSDASLKNEFKRQSFTDAEIDPNQINLEMSGTEADTTPTTTTTTTTTTSTTEEPSSTTEESKNGSLSDLEDSFGGPDPITEEPSPPPKINGFYFLADWNSFLEVGEAGNDQVIVRLDPKIGDPRRFLKVTVP